MHHIMTLKHVHSPLWEYQACARSSLLSFMGIFSTESLPVPLPRDEGFWERTVDFVGPPIEGLPEGDDPDGWYLRPDWTASWHDNAEVWGLKVINRIKLYGHQYSSSLTAADLALIPTDRISKAVETVFNGLAERYKLETSEGGDEKRRKRGVGTKLRARKKNVSGKEKIPYL